MLWVVAPYNKVKNVVKLYLHPDWSANDLEKVNWIYLKTNRNE